MGDNQKLENSSLPSLIDNVIEFTCGGALVETFVTRTLILVMPVTIITTLGVLKSVNFFRALRERQVIVSVFLFVIFCLGQLAMTIDVLKNSALWFNDYGLYGMQYGGQQVFASVNDYLLKNPDAEAIVTYKWLNGPTMVMRFFVQEPEKVILEDWKTINKPDFQIKENSLLVITANEWSTVSDLDRQRYKILKMIPYPDQSPGFYFLQLRSN